MRGLKSTLAKMSGMRVLVIGDLIIDEYITCDALGMSQEDPTIVVTPIVSKTFVGGAGGGLPEGVVIGRSSSNGGEPNSEPVRIPNLIGTVMHTLFDVGQLRIMRGVSREVTQIADYAPIRGLHG